MSALVAPSLYNNLPSLGEANASIQDPSVDAIINGPIRDVFLKHAAHVSLCLYLLHRHHHVTADETVIKVNGTAHVMNGQAIKDVVSFGNKVVPTTWMTSDGQVLPMEYAVVPASIANSVPMDAFISDFLSVLKSNGYEGLFGIDTIAKGDWTEMSIGNASVVVSSGGSEHYPENFIPVAFAFDEDKPKFRVHGKCGKDHSHTSKPTK